MSWLAHADGVARAVFHFDRLPTKSRPRFAGGHTYTPKATSDAEKYIRSEYLSQNEARGDFDGSVQVLIVVHRHKPKSAAKRFVGAPDLKTPDADNVAKLFCDALNGVAYKDDRQITDLSVHFMPLSDSEHTSVELRINYYTHIYVKD